MDTLDKTNESFLNPTTITTYESQKIKRLKQIYWKENWSNSLTLFYILWTPKTKYKQNFI